MAVRDGGGAHAGTGSAREVMLAFAKLGLTSFGGPVAHLGYFRHEFVVRRRWVDEQSYADLIALCQFLPGPASSQVGFSLGLMRAGYIGALAAWVGFTLPSALLLALFASVAHRLQSPMGAALLHGLKLVAVAIVAQAVWGMARTLCPEWRRALIAVAAGAAALLLQSAFTQLAVIAVGAVLGKLMQASWPPPVTMTYLPRMVSPPRRVHCAGVVCGIARRFAAGARGRAAACLV
jgi:chromate transporter